jgi:hypothetical protein
MQRPPAPPPTKYGSRPAQPAIAVKPVPAIRCAPPPTRFGPAPAAAQPKRQIAPPPPTRFGPAPAAVQPKAAIAPPPPTRFGPVPAAVQHKLQPAPPPARAVPAPPHGLALQRKSMPAPAASSRHAGVIQRMRIGYFGHAKSKDAREFRESNDPGGCNVATVHYQVLSTGIFATRTMQSNKRHTEGLLFDWLEATYPGDYDVDWLYTELETCGSDYHNCRDRVTGWFPNAQVYYSISYPSKDTVSTDDDDDKSDLERTELRKRRKATRRRARTTPILKRFSTKLKKRREAGEDSGDEVEMDDFKPAMKVPYSPYRDDQNLDPGVEF